MCFFTGALTTFLYFDIIHYYSMISNYNGLMNYSLQFVFWDYLWLNIT